MIRVLLILFAVVVFALIALTVIDEHVLRWGAAAFASWAASTLEFSDFAIPRRRPGRAA